MEFVKFIILIFLGITELFALKVDTYSHSLINSLNNNSNDDESESTQMIEIYNDKALTQKIINFENVSYNIHTSNKNIKEGLLFDTTKSGNAGIAMNYFEDKSTKLTDKTALIRFTNFYKCEVFSVARPSLNSEVVQIGVVDKTGKPSYMVLSYSSSNKENKKALADKILHACTTYVDLIKKKMDDFWKEVDNYWKIKSSAANLGNKVDSTSDKFKKENEQLEGIVRDKQNFEKNREDNKVTLNKIKSEKDGMQIKLREEYKIINDIKTKRAINEKNLTNLNDTLRKLDDEAKQVQERLDKMNLESAQMRNRSDEVIQLLTDTNKKMFQIETNLTSERKNKFSIDNEIDSMNKQMNKHGKNIAKLNKDIKKSKDLLDTIKVEDLPNVVNKTKAMVEESELESAATLNETRSVDEQIKRAEKIILKMKDKMQKLLAKPDVIKKTVKAKIKKNIEKAQVAFEAMRKIFPILPEVYVTNLWNFVTLNHYESMNYLQAIKPSYFGLFDNIFQSNDPNRVKKPSAAASSK
jgi:hypothetical protein